MELDFAVCETGEGWVPYYVVGLGVELYYAVGETVLPDFSTDF